MKRRNFIKASLAIPTLAAIAVFPDSASATVQPQANKKESRQMSIQDFAEKYITLWSTIDDEQRKTLAIELFDESAEHYAAPANVSFIGRDAILTNITNVNKGAIQTAGLKFKSGNSLINHDAISVEWSAEAPNGHTVRSGRDILILNDEGKATRLYMFTSD